MAKKLSSATSIREVLTGQNNFGGEVYLSGHRLGTFVTHGSSDGKGKMVYASRIYLRNLRIEVKATNRSGMLDKVAKAISAGVKEGLFDIDTFVANGKEILPEAVA